MRSKSTSGFTLIELMMAVSIIGVLATIMAPRIQLVLERAYEGKTRSQLGALRSALALYYSDTEGKVAYTGWPDGVPPDGVNLTSILTPRYIPSVQAPFLADHFPYPPGLYFDVDSKTNIEHVPPRDVVFAAGPPAAILADRPYVYDPTSGTLYICDGNYSVAGEFYYNW